MVAKGNPLGIQTFADISKEGVRYVNRQKGSGTRILTDYLCKQNELNVDDIYGYDREELTHTSVAAQIVSGSADAGMGIYSAAKLYDLDFIPICIEEYDLIIAIATTAAQIMVTAADGNVPIVFAAVSDPAGNGLTGMGNVTGTSDALNTPFILDMMYNINPEIKTVGLLYSNSEPNSQKPIAEAKEYLDAKGIAYIEKTGTTSGEIVEAAASLVGRAEAVFTPTDNAVMAAEAAVAELLNAGGIAHYTGADSFVQSGAFTTCGVNYTELGTKSADIAFDILMGGEIGEFVVMDGGIITVNTDTAAKLNLDFSIFAEMANTLVEVTTG